VCNQKFPGWPPGARTANGTALCHWMQLYRYFMSQSNEFCLYNTSCCFSTGVCCCWFRYGLSPETFGYTLVLTTFLGSGRWMLLPLISALVVCIQHSVCLTLTRWRRDALPQWLINPTSTYPFICFKHAYNVWFCQSEGETHSLSDYHPTSLIQLFVPDTRFVPEFAKVKMRHSSSDVFTPLYLIIYLFRTLLLCLPVLKAKVRRTAFRCLIYPAPPYLIICRKIVTIMQNVYK
jgi:hypothetical protein